MGGRSETHVEVEQDELCGNLGCEIPIAGDDCKRVSTQSSSLSDRNEDRTRSTRPGKKDCGIGEELAGRPCRQSLTLKLERSRVSIHGEKTETIIAGRAPWRRGLRRVQKEELETRGEAGLRHCSVRHR